MEIRNQGTPLLFLRMPMGSNIKLKQREDLGQITCQPSQRLAQLNMINPNPPNPRRLSTPTLPCKAVAILSDPSKGLSGVHLPEQEAAGGVCSARLKFRLSCWTFFLARLWKAVGLFLLTFLLSPLTPQGWLLSAF